jgi:hypothetical protein
MQQLINGQYDPHQLPYTIISAQHVWNKVQQLNFELILQGVSQRII